MMNLNKIELEDLLSFCINNGAEFAQIYYIKKTKCINKIGLNDKKEMLVEEGISLNFFIDKVSYHISSSGANIKLLKKKVKKFFYKKNKISNNHITLNTLLIYGKNNELEKFNIDNAKKSINDFIKEKDNKKLKAKITLISEKDEILIANSNGKYLKKFDYLYKIDLIVKIIENNKTRYNYCTKASTININKLCKVNYKEILDELYDKLIKITDVNINDVTISNIIIEKGISGMIFHEACGHALESREINLKKSVFNNLRQVKNQKITLVDNPELSELFGSYMVDDEGNRANKKILIDKGIIKNYLTENLDEVMGFRKCNGSARRENYYFPISSRMSNTYIENGKDVSNEIIKKMKSAIYIKNIVGGVVDTISGNFSFNVIEAYIIKNGKIDYTKVIDNISIIGNTLDLLNNTEMIGNEIEFIPGYCGSKGGFINTTVGGPLVMIKKMLVVKNDK